MVKFRLLFDLGSRLIHRSDDLFGRVPIHDDDHVILIAKFFHILQPVLIPLTVRIDQIDAPILESQIFLRVDPGPYRASDKQKQNQKIVL